MLAFAEALPRIRESIERDLALRRLPRERVLATVVRLLETTLIRVGNEEYARENRHYGLTTLRNRHVEVDGSDLRFHFRGKSGLRREVGVRDRRLAGIIRRLQALPGQELFQYLDEHGETHAVGSSEVNGYLRAISGQEFSAKDFRTWAGTVLAAMALQEVGVFGSEAQAKKNVVRAIERVAQQLGNTPALCRKCYVHPAVLDAYLDGSMLQTLAERAGEELAGSNGDLRPEESAVLALLERRLQCEAAGAARARHSANPLDAGTKPRRRSTV
jgi:DNA topoisomerase-1